MEEFEKVINYTFKDKELLKVALTHSSYANEHKKQHLKYNERLEFLGDAVLSISVSDYIFNNCPQLPEGDLTKLRASLVCEKSLFVFAKKINLGKYIYLSNGERKGGGAERPSILSDAFEAVIAAIYLDGGMEKASEFVLSFVVENLAVKIILFILASIILFAGVSFALKIETETGYYECGKCHNKYIPTYLQVYFAIHFKKNRYMKCPKCGEKSWNKKILIK